MTCEQPIANDTTMQVAIIENSDCPETADFVVDETGARLLFSSYEAADDWLMANAVPGIAYEKWDDDDD